MDVNEFFVNAVAVVGGVAVTIASGGTSVLSEVIFKFAYGASRISIVIGTYLTIDGLTNLINADYQTAIDSLTSVQQDLKSVNILSYKQMAHKIMTANDDGWNSIR